MSTEKDILDVISGLRAQKRELEESIKERVVAIDHDLEAAVRILDLIRELKGVTTESQPHNGLIAADLNGMSQMTALQAIATYNHGILVVRDAARLFREAGLSKSKYISQGIYSKVLRSNRFEYAAPGRFRLLTHPEPDHSGRQQEQLHI